MCEKRCGVVCGLVVVVCGDCMKNVDMWFW